MAISIMREDAVDTADHVDLRVPADPAYLAVVRTATAGLAARLDLTLDEIEDLRVAVDEACVLLLERHAHPGQSLQTSFCIGPNTLEVVITGPVTTLPDRSGFSWAVLAALVNQVETGAQDTGSWIRLTYHGGRRG
jgi:serine/threonine-protein kinase RsbW